MGTLLSAAELLLKKHLSVHSHSYENPLVLLFLKQSGMRWIVPGAQAVLTLRAKVESRLWHCVKALFAA